MLNNCILFNHRLQARIDTDKAGAGLCLGEPSWRCAFKSLRKRACTGLLKPHRSFAARMALLRFAQESLGENVGLRLVCQAGRCFEKAFASLFASIFSKTDSAFAQ
jgi:hypothetical protein